MGLKSPETLECDSLVRDELTVLGIPAAMQNPSIGNPEWELKPEQTGVDAKGI